MRSVPVVAKAGVTARPVTLGLLRSFTVPSLKWIPHHTALKSETRSQRSASVVDAGRVALSRRKRPSLPRPVANRSPRRQMLRASAKPATENAIIAGRKADHLCQLTPQKPVFGKMAQLLPVMRRHWLTMAVPMRVRRQTIAILVSTVARICMPRSILVPTIAAS